MLDLNAFAKEVHAVAVEHGWWEGEENNDIDTKIALIHAEWSEALEEYRAGRPMVWHRCYEAEKDEEPVCVENACVAWANGDCGICSRDKKPEGIAVELVDGCLRIMDLMGRMGFEVKWEECIGGPLPLPKLVKLLHYTTAIGGVLLYQHGNGADAEGAKLLSSCIGSVQHWLTDLGVDFEAVMLAKHAYNKTRSYRHGGKRC